MPQARQEYPSSLVQSKGVFRACSLFGEMLVVPTARALPCAVHLHFRESPADSSNLSWSPETWEPILQGNVSPATASREHSAQHRTPGFACGLAQHGPIPLLGQWRWTQGQKSEIWVSCWDTLHRLEAHVPLCFLYCHLISFLPFSEDKQRRSLLRTRDAAEEVRGLQIFLYLDWSWD